MPHGGKMPRKLQRAVFTALHDFCLLRKLTFADSRLWSCFTLTINFYQLKALSFYNNNLTNLSGNWHIQIKVTHSLLDWDDHTAKVDFLFTSPRQWQQVQHSFSLCRGKKCFSFVAFPGKNSLVPYFIALQKCNVPVRTLKVYLSRSDAFPYFADDWLTVIDTFFRSRYSVHQSWRPISNKNFAVFSSNDHAQYWWNSWATIINKSIINYPFCNVGLSIKLFLPKRRFPMCKLRLGKPRGKTNCRVLTAK